MITGMMEEEGIGKDYAADFLTYITESMSIFEYSK
jgi:hypothetical protein